MPNTSQPPPTFQPGLRIADDLAGFWLRQVTVRLRREVTWLWHERSGEVDASGKLPPFSDPLIHVLDQTRFAAQRQQFYRADETALYLSQLLEAPEPTLATHTHPRGSFAWLATELSLKPVERFVLTLALCPIIDSSAETVLAACLNHPNAKAPTLALAQRLWDAPEELLPLASMTHPFFSYGLLQPPESGYGAHYDTPLQMAPEVAQTLIAGHAQLPDVFEAIVPGDEPINESLQQAIGRIRAGAASRALIVPVLGQFGQSLGPLAATIAAACGRRLVAARGLPGKLATSDEFLTRLMSLAWLHGVDLYLRFNASAHHGNSHESLSARASLPLPNVPIHLFVGLDRRSQVTQLPPSQCLAPAVASPIEYQQRLDAWRRFLPGATSDELDCAVRECARRFRYPINSIAELCRGLCALGRPYTAGDLYAACRADLNLGELAQLVEPRFEQDDLMLPPKQQRQFTEILNALQALSLVHYEWGAAKVWNEGGLSALFAGPPGTGKTMAAEVIAAITEIPLYRIDLSQVVNKYIGETEKNLSRLFDAAEASDAILFFDEADSVFGKRSEVKDAHDRYANLEVSYLLERMERFKGLAILATNRKKDLDDAFLRRIRFFIEFPMPGESERKRIWQHAIPPQAPCADIDFDFLAARFPLAGGHIRSIVFNACLQSANATEAQMLNMEAIIVATKREYDKLDRNLSLEQFGSYAALVDDPR